MYLLFWPAFPVSCILQGAYHKLATKGKQAKSCKMFVGVQVLVSLDS